MLKEQDTAPARPGATAVADTYPTQRGGRRRFGCQESTSTFPACCGYVTMNKSSSFQFKAKFSASYVKAKLLILEEFR